MCWPGGSAKESATRPGSTSSFAKPWNGIGGASLLLHNFVAVKLHPHAQPTVPSTDRPYMNHMPHANPVACGRVGDFFRHLKLELNPGASAYGQIRCKVHTSRRNIDGLCSVSWRARV